MRGCGRSSRGDYRRRQRARNMKLAPRWTRLRESPFSRAWLFGAIIWLIFSLTVIVQHIRIGPQPRYVGELCVLLGLLWAEFGFAGMFHTLTRERGRRLFPFALVTLVPPLLLCVLSFAAAWWMGASPHPPAMSPAWRRNPDPGGVRGVPFEGVRATDAANAPNRWLLI